MAKYLIAAAAIFWAGAFASSSALSEGQVVTLAGSLGSTGSANGYGTNAKFNYPNGAAFSNGVLYVADQFNHLIREIVVSTGEVSTLAGSTGNSGAKKQN